MTEVLREQSSGEDGTGYAGLVEQTSEDLCDKDKDSQTSTVESGYESQSKDHLYIAGPVPPSPLPRSLLTKDFSEVNGELESEEHKGSPVKILSVVSAFETCNRVSEVR